MTGAGPSRSACIIDHSARGDKGLTFRLIGDANGNGSDVLNYSSLVNRSNKTLLMTSRVTAPPHRDGGTRQSRQFDGVAEFLTF